MDNSSYPQVCDSIAYFGMTWPWNSVDFESVAVKKTHLLPEIIGINCLVRRTPFPPGAQLQYIVFLSASLRFVKTSHNSDTAHEGSNSYNTLSLVQLIP